jgi:hypothetical protein
MRETLEPARTALVTVGQAGQPDRWRWPVLGVVGLAQLISVLEATRQSQERAHSTARFVPPRPAKATSQTATSFLLSPPR